MKALKVLFALALFVGFTTNVANGQATSTKDLEIPWSVYIDCAGEMVSGTLNLHTVVISNKNENLWKIHNQPMGGSLMGEISGMVYHPTGVTQSKGYDPYSYINLFHIVGNGIQFFVKAFYHYVILPDGDFKVVVDKYEVICK